MRRLFALLAASLLTLVLSTGPAAAHAKLESLTPADGSTLAAPPSKVVLTFNEPVGSNGTQIQVTSPAGINVATGTPQVIDNTVTQPVGAMIETGRYAVQARVVSADGHPITITAGFTITHAGHAPGAPPVDPTTPQPTDNSNVVTIVAMCLVMLVVVALAIVIVRRRPAAQ